MPSMLHLTYGLPANKKAGDGKIAGAKLPVRIPFALDGRVAVREADVQMMPATISCGKRFKVVRHVAGVAL